MAFVEQTGFLCKTSFFKQTAELGVHRPHTTDKLLTSHPAVHVSIIKPSTVRICQAVRKRKKRTTQGVKL